MEYLSSFPNNNSKATISTGEGREKNVFQTHGKSDRIDIDRNFFFFFSKQIAKYRIVVGVAIKTSYSNIEMHLEMS